MTAFNRLFYWGTRPFVVILMVLAVALCYVYVDRPLAQWMLSHHFKENIRAIYWLTQLGRGPIYFALFFVLGVMFRYVWMKPIWEARAWFLWLCAVVPSLICSVLKCILGRARPMQWFDADMYGFYGMKLKAAFMSFPSGHTTVIMGVMFGLMALFPRYWWSFLTLGVCVALSRVFLVQHYLSDVWVASYLALLEVGLMSHVFQRHGWFKKAWPAAPAAYTGG